MPYRAAAAACTQIAKVNGNCKTKKDGNRPVLITLANLGVGFALVERSKSLSGSPRG